jgi:hypothetical protein
MRTGVMTACLATTMAFTGIVASSPAGAEEAAAEAETAPAPDPTRGQWDAFLDPVRDAEDQLVGVQKSIEDSTKIHVGAGFTWPTWFHDFNEPDSDIITLHSLDPDHASPEFNFGQLSLLRPSEGWIPGFGIKLDVGRAAKRIKSDWDGDGTVDRRDTFEKNSFDVEEAYLTWTVPEDMAAKGLTVKAGKFVTLLGAEVIEPWANFNYSRSFLFSLAIPFTHTGGLVSYPISEKVSVTAGAVEGWDKVQSNNQGWSGIGNVTYVATDQVTLAANGIWGPEQNNKTGNKRGVADLVATIKPTSALTLLLNYDWGHEDGAAAGNEAGLWQGFAAVANYAFTDRASVAVRGEWFEDHGGTRTGVVQSLYEATVTGKYLMTQHLYGQVEYRHDESAKGNFFPADSPGVVNGPTGPNPITKFTSGQDIIGFAVTYVFN